MADNLSPEVRSKIMASIKGKDTKPEIVVRKLLFNSGFRYRLHKKDLPGKPDIILKKYHAVIFVHGCFWHMHNCHFFRMPSTRAMFWAAKLERNIAKDKENTSELFKNGWRVLEIYECAIMGKAAIAREVLLEQIIAWLFSNESHGIIEGSL